MELKRDEIKKALECCANNGECKECPINPHKGNYGYCTSLAINHALALINKLTEENEFLHTTITVNAQLALEVTLEEIEKAKADTVREMQERLKEYLDDFYNSGEDALLDVPDLIDQTAKEMLEGNNEV